MTFQVSDFKCNYFLDLLDNELYTIKLLYIKEVCGSSNSAIQIHYAQGPLGLLQTILLYVVATTHHSRTNDLTTSKALQWAIK